MITKVKNSSFDAQNNFGYVSLFDTGCVGDGVTDDTIGFNLALSYGVPVFIPIATFLINSINLPANTTLFGEGGKSLLILKASAASPLLTVANNCSLRTFGIDGNKSAQINPNLHGIYLPANTNVKISGISISNPNGDCINITGVGSNITISSCVGTGYTKNGITVESGDDISLITNNMYMSDGLANPGNGIGLMPASSGASLTNVTLNGNVCKSNVGKGIGIIGATVKNVTNVTLLGNRVANNISHGLHIITAQQILESGTIAKSNGGDGVRIEGDVVNSRFTNTIVDSNLGTGMREVTNVSTPDHNGFIYNVAVNNGNNTISKLGANSFVI